MVQRESICGGFENDRTDPSSEGDYLVQRSGEGRMRCGTGQDTGSARDYRISALIMVGIGEGLLGWDCDGLVDLNIRMRGWGGAFSDVPSLPSFPDPAMCAGVPRRVDMEGPECAGC